MIATNADKSALGNRAAAEREIRRQVQQLAVGEKLPSIRTFRRQFDVGQAVVERLFNQLKEEGLITVRPKSGSFRCAPPPLPIHLIYRHSVRDLKVGSFYGDFISKLLLLLAETGHPVHLHTGSSRDELTNVLNRLRHTSCRLMTFGMNWDDLGLTRGREWDRFTAVHVLPNFMELIPASVNIDDQAAIRLQLEHVADLGHRRIAYLHRCDSRFWIRAEHARFAAFHENVIRLGLNISPESLQFVGMDYEYLERAMADICSARPRATAIVLSNDLEVRGVYRGLRQRGLEPGRDITVVGMNNAVWCEHLTPSLTSIRISVDQGAAHVHDILAALEAGEDAPALMIKPDLIVRESSCPPPAASKITVDASQQDLAHIRTKPLHNQSQLDPS